MFTSSFILAKLRRGSLILRADLSSWSSEDLELLRKNLGKTYVLVNKYMMQNGLRPISHLVFTPSSKTVTAELALIPRLSRFFTMPSDQDLQAALNHALSRIRETS